MRKFIAFAVFTLLFAGALSDWSIQAELRPPLPVINSTDTI